MRITLLLASIFLSPPRCWGFVSPKRPCRCTNAFVASKENAELTSISIGADNLSKENEVSKESPKAILTSAVLRISYDGARFTGWSDSNENGKSPSAALSRPSKRRRRRGVIGELRPGHVRSVEGVLRQNLARIFGNIDPKRIITEGCSRTDSGVHAKGMVAQVYCLKEGVLEALQEDETTIHCSIPGKRKPHPTTPTDDAYFEPMPMDGNLSRLAFALNRMKPSDLQITGIAPTPPSSSLKDSDKLPFHPSLSSTSKTYEYRFSVGGFHDPTLQRLIWHVGDVNMDLDQISRGCELFEGTHDFSAFRGAPRGSDDKRKLLEKQSDPEGSQCTLSSVRVVEEAPPMVDYFVGVNPPIRHFKITITGDRFLYKMVRFLVGSLVAVGMGRLDLVDMERALESGNWTHENRRKEFECAPAHGLVLRNASYDDIDFDWQPLRF